jgi:tripartite-type tricarboxylate transporter receptor subunit TctC
MLNLGPTALLLAGMLASVGTCVAQAYPARYIRMIVPYVPGGGTDTLTRLIAPRLGETLGQQIIIDNRAGGSSAVGTEVAAKAPPDGYTLVMVDTSFTTNPALYGKLPFDPVKDFAPVSLVASAPVILVVHPSVPIRNVKEFVTLAKARPGELNFASGAPGSSTHLGGELLKSVAKVDVVNIPYKGTGQAITDVLGGQVGMMFAGISTVRQHVRAGKLRAIAVTGEKRAAAMPEVPTFSESGLVGVDSGTYWGCLAPAATPKDIVNKVSAALHAVVESADIKPKLEERGYTVIGSVPERFGENIRSEITKWAKVIKTAGIKVEAQQ